MTSKLIAELERRSKEMIQKSGGLLLKEVKVPDVKEMPNVVFGKLLQDLRDVHKLIMQRQEMLESAKADLEVEIEAGEEIADSLETLIGEMEEHEEGRR